MTAMAMDLRIRFSLQTVLLIQYTGEEAAASRKKKGRPGWGAL
jgi:hypothetical protein